MKQTQLNQLIQNAEGILLKQKAAKGDMSEAISEVKKVFNAGGVEMTLAQAVKFSSEYFAKRLTGEK